MAAQDTIHYRFLVRGGTAAALAAVNEVPLKRELVVETDTGFTKLGDGVTRYNDLVYIGGPDDRAGIHTVTGTPPPGLGEDGDYAIDPAPSNPRLFGPKSAGAWPAGVALKGPQGDRGQTGSTGPRGPDGLSAYQVAVANGFAGSQAAWLESLKGAKGDRGETGPPGGTLRRILDVPNTDSGSFACDWSAYDEIRLLLTTDTSLSFAGAADGQGCILKLKQDATGGHAVTLPAAVRFNALIQTYTSTRTPGKADKIGFVFDGGDSRYDFVSIVPGI